MNLKKVINRKGVGEQTDTFFYYKNYFVPTCSPRGFYEK